MYACFPDNKQPHCQIFEEWSSRREQEKAFLYHKMSLVFSMNGNWLPYLKIGYPVTFEAKKCFQGMAISFFGNGNFSEMSKGPFL